MFRTPLADRIGFSRQLSGAINSACDLILGAGEVPTIEQVQAMYKETQDNSNVAPSLDIIRVCDVAAPSWTKPKGALEWSIALSLNPFLYGYPGAQDNGDGTWTVGYRFFHGEVNANYVPSDFGQLTRGSSAFYTTLDKSIGLAMGSYATAYPQVAGYNSSNTTYMFDLGAPVEIDKITVRTPSAIYQRYNGYYKHRYTWFSMVIYPWNEETQSWDTTNYANVSNPSRTNRAEQTVALDKAITGRYFKAVVHYDYYNSGGGPAISIFRFGTSVEPVGFDTSKTVTWAALRPKALPEATFGLAADDYPVILFEASDIGLTGSGKSLTLDSLDVGPFEDITVNLENKIKVKVGPDEVL